MKKDPESNFLDNLTLQNQEHRFDTSVLEEPAQMTIELESSLYFASDEEDEDLSEGATSRPSRRHRGHQ